MFTSLWSWGSTPAPAYGETDAYWYLSPTPEQQASLVSFRKALEDGDLLVPRHDDDHTLLRFLMARDWKQDKALSMYSDMRAWRQEVGADALYGDDPAGEAFPEMQRLLQVYPHFTCCTDRFGRPVYIELLGRTDAAALFETISMERLIRYHIWTWERYLRRYLPACSAAARTSICTTTVIIDLEGLSLSHFNAATQKLLNTFSKIDQDYYPEHLGTMFVINTPLIFRGMWAAVQPLLQERTRKKIIILGQDYLPEVTKIVPLENLPTLLGGKVRLDAAYTSVGPWQEQQQQQQQQAEGQQRQGQAEGGAGQAPRGQAEGGEGEPQGARGQAEGSEAGVSPCTCTGGSVDADGEGEGVDAAARVQLQGLSLGGKGVAGEQRKGLGAGGGAPEPMISSAAQTAEVVA